MNSGQQAREAPTFVEYDRYSCGYYSSMYIVRTGEKQPNIVQNRHRPHPDHDGWDK
jgi:hypothetical protein